MFDGGNPIFNLFGGALNFQQRFNQFQQSLPQGFNPQNKVQELLNTGQMSPQQFEQFRKIADSITGRGGPGNSQTR